MRVRIGRDIFGTMTPLKDDLSMTKYTSIRQLTPKYGISLRNGDNPQMSGSEINCCPTLPKDSVESRRYGRFSEAEALVYKELPETHVIDPFDAAGMDDNISIDPGLNNPLSCHFYAVDYDGVIYVIAEH